MGKHTQKKHTRIPIQSGHPGCVWSIVLHVIQSRHWQEVKKGLPHRRHGGHKHARGDGNPRNKKASNAGKSQGASGDQVNSSNEVRPATSANKNSVRAKIKSLISEEFSKRKGQHHRSSTDLVRSQVTRTASIHQKEASQKDFPPKIPSTDESPETVNESNEDSNPTISMDSLLQKSLEKPIANEETSEDYQAMLTGNDLDHKQVDGNDTRLREKQMLSHENLEYAKQASFEQKLINTNDLSRDASFYQSKEFLDTLNIFNINKEFFPEVLLDPSSSLALHFHNQHNQQTLSARMGLTKSETFPMPGLSGKIVPGPSKLKHEQDATRSHGKEEGKLKVVGQAQNSTECESVEDIYKQSMPSSVVEDRVDEIQKRNHTAADIADSSSSCSPHHFKNLSSNQVVIKRFNDLKQKIKHLIRESKNERHRIAMDAVLHKVPHRQGFSKDLKDEILEKLKGPSSKSDGKDSPRSSSQRDHKAQIDKEFNHMRRTSSLNETLDRYCQLYESSSNTEAKQHISGTLELSRKEAASPSRSTPKSLGRILSLPELKSYFYPSEDISDAISSWTAARIPIEETENMSSSGEQNSTDIPITSEFFSQLDNPVESQIQENLVEASDTDSGTRDQVGSTSIADSNAHEVKLSDDTNNLITRDNASDSEWDIEPKTTEQSEPSPVTVLDFNFQEAGESTAEFSISEELEEKLGFLLPGVQDSLISHQHEYSMDTPRVAHNSNIEKVEFPSKQAAIKIPYVQVDAKDKAKYDYVAYILELSGFSGNESPGTWHSDYQRVDPSIYEEEEGCILLDPECSANEGGTCNHISFFDLINEVLMEIYERSYSYYPTPLSSLCRLHTMPSGHHVLKEVWANITWYLSLRLEVDQSLDYIASTDLSKNDGWINLQFSSECVGLEVEDLIFEELLEEVIFS